jgi:hypothetical protein
MVNRDHTRLAPGAYTVVLRTEGAEVFKTIAVFN